MPKHYRVAYLLSHPIQYQSPLLRYITNHSEIDLETFFLSDFSLHTYQDKEFNAQVAWDVPLTEGFKHQFLPAWGSTSAVTSLRPFTQGIRQRLAAGGFDALWLHGYAHQASIRALFAAKSLGLKVMVRSENQLGSALRRQYTRSVKEASLRFLLSQIDAFLPIGTLNREYFLHYGAPPNRLFPVPYTVDNAFFQHKVAEARPRRSALCAELGLEPTRPIILYASKFTARKRAGDVLEAYARLSSDGLREPHPYLLFVGDGEERQTLEARSQALGWQSVKFLGFKNQSELPALFDLCNVFVLASEREPWGLIVNEVMNAGKPVIVSDGVGSYPDLVRDGENGYVVPVGDVLALSDRLWSLTMYPENARRMGDASLNIINTWSFREDLKGLEAALDTVVGAGKL